jgi:hypothetical protein
MKKLFFLSLIVVGTSFADPLSQPPTQPSSPSTFTSSQSQSLSTESPTPVPQTSITPNVTSPSATLSIELKPEDKAIIRLKKKMAIKQTYNEYQKVDKATSIDKINLEKSLREAKYALKTQIYKEKQLNFQLLYPYYYSIPIRGVVGNVVLTDQTTLKDGTVLKGKDRIFVKDGLVYVKDYLISYPVMEHIKQPKVEEVASLSVPQLLTGLPTANSSGNSLVGSPPMPLPPPIK